MILKGGYSDRGIDFQYIVHWVNTNIRSLENYPGKYTYIISTIILWSLQFEIHFTNKYKYYNTSS